MPRKILLVPLGSLGDLHPFLALGTALRAAGHTPVVATGDIFPGDIFRKAIEDSGLTFQKIRPDQDEFLRAVGMTWQEVARRVRWDQTFFLRKLLHFLSMSTLDLLDAAKDADAVVTHRLSMGGKLAAEKLRIPRIDVVISPLLFFSAYDPPIGLSIPYVHRSTALGLLWNRTLFGLIKRMVDSTMARPVHEVRADLGLPPMQGAPLVEDELAAASIGLFSPLLCNVQPDFPKNTSIVGFSFYDGAKSQALDPEVEEFLAAGSPPVVVTLGSFAAGASDLFRIAFEAIQSLGRRSVILIGHDDLEVPGIAPGPNVLLLRRYLPYSLLFPRAAAIVHHGGISTTALALRAGRPQLVVSVFADQPDNARRIARLGVGRWLKTKQCSAATIRTELSALLDAPWVAERAEAIGQIVSTENGPAEAVRVIEKIIVDAEGRRRG